VKRILVIDSEEVILNLFPRLFRDKGWKVVTTDSGSRAIELVKKDGFKFVFLEYRIRDVDGLTTFRIIRTIAPYVKVIMMFAYPKEELIEEARKLGVERFLTKPFDLRELTNIIEKDY
jgi:two-component system response regulator (stage 0 sporulation protein F)